MLGCSGGKDCHFVKRTSPFSLSHPILPKISAAFILVASYGILRATSFASSFGPSQGLLPDEAWHP